MCSRPRLSKSAVAAKQDCHVPEYVDAALAGVYSKRIVASFKARLIYRGFFAPQGKVGLGTITGAANGWLSMRGPKSFLLKGAAAIILLTIPNNHSVKWPMLSVNATDSCRQRRAVFRDRVHTLANHLSVLSSEHT